MTQHAQILIVDDQPWAKQSLRALLSTCPSAAQIREAVDGQEAVQFVKERQPDVVAATITSCVRAMPLSLMPMETTRRLPDGE